jgi:hypothetical protein
MVTAMGWPDAAAAELLSGPRGRRLCWSLLDAGDDPRWDRVRDGAMAGSLARLIDELAASVTLTDLDSIAAETDELALLAALVQPVETAMYWQQPDDDDQALADQAVQEALLPVAQAVVAAPAGQWWPTPAAGDRQHYVEWLGEHDYSPALTGAASELAAWHSAIVEDERSARKRPKDPSASWSGYWWSTPAPSRLPSTTRSIPGIGAVGLALVEDGLGWRQARCWPMEPRADARIFEISGPDQWTHLVGRYPMNVSNSRRHDWWRATGRTGKWLIPDFSAVASDYDAVHVTVAGYLATAGRALPVDDAHTVLAGWGPDQTFWLTEVLTSSGPATAWVELDDGPFGWTLSGASVQPE